MQVVCQTHKSISFCVVTVLAWLNEGAVNNRATVIAPIVLGLTQVKVHAGVDPGIATASISAAIVLTSGESK